MSQGGEFVFVDALEHLTSSIDDEANLNSTARTAVSKALMAFLSSQLSVQQHVARHPEIASLTIPSPVFLVGLPEAGTRLLQNLLAHHPGLHVPRLWELLTAAGPPGREHREEAIRAAHALADGDPCGSGASLAGDDTGAQLPGECHDLLVSTFQSMTFPMRYDVPSYVRWLSRRDMTTAYRFHRLLMQSIRWRTPDGILVLACPFHAWSLGALARMYPDAWFVAVHRSPTEAISSICELCARLRVAVSDSVDPRAIGSFWLRQVDRALRAMQAARSTLLAGGRVIDVRHSDLMEDPMGTASRICDLIGLTVTAPFAERMRSFLAVNPPAPGGGAVETFGLRRARLQERFADYQRAFNL